MARDFDLGETPEVEADLDPNITDPGELDYSGPLVFGEEPTGAIGNLSQLLEISTRRSQVEAMRERLKIVVGPYLEEQIRIQVENEAKEAEAKEFETLGSEWTQLKVRGFSRSLSEADLRASWAQKDQRLLEMAPMQRIKCLTAFGRGVGIFNAKASADYQNYIDRLNGSTDPQAETFKSFYEEISKPNLSKQSLSFFFLWRPIYDLIGDQPTRDELQNFLTTNPGFKEIMNGEFALRAQPTPQIELLSQWFGYRKLMSEEQIPGKRADVTETRTHLEELIAMQIDPKRQAIAAFRERLENQKNIIDNRQQQIANLEQKKQEVDENIEKYEKVFKDLGYEWQSLTFYNVGTKKERLPELQRIWAENYPALQVGTSESRFRIFAAFLNGLGALDNSTKSMHQRYASDIGAQTVYSTHPASRFLKNIGLSYKGMEASTGLGVFLGAFFELAQFSPEEVTSLEEHYKSKEVSDYIKSEPRMTNINFSSSLNAWFESY